MSSNIKTLGDAFRHLAKLIEEYEEPTPVATQFDGGFKIGDEVTFVSGGYPQGIKGVVADHEAAASVKGYVPVVRDDNGRKDVFPAKRTILTSSLEAYAPVKEVPPTKEELFEFNLDLLECAEDEDCEVEFLYRKEDGSVRLRHVKNVVLIEDTRDNGNDYIICLDLDADAPRQFRIERIIDRARIVND